jgi:hypothetical protein
MVTGTLREMLVEGHVAYYQCLRCRAERVMLPAAAWLQEFGVDPNDSAQGKQLALLRPKFRVDIIEVTMVLPRLPRHEFWDLDRTFPGDHAGLTGERQRWAKTCFLPWDYLRFWTAAEMALFEASFEARARRVPAARAAELYSGECDAELVSFVDLLGCGASERAAAVVGSGSGCEGGGALQGGNPFDALADAHFLFELWHTWRVGFGGRVPLRFAHVRGYDAWDFLHG